MREGWRSRRGRLGDAGVDVADETVGRLVRSAGEVWEVGCGSKRREDGGWRGNLYLTPA